jgi:hypothetical protein
MPVGGTFVEIGVHRSQILTLYGLLCKRLHTEYPVKRIGISPMNGSGTGYSQDFNVDAVLLHEKYDVPQDYIIIQDYSTKPETVVRAQAYAPFDVLYVDGSHDTLDVKFDLEHYAPMVKVGGVLVIDDANCNVRDIMYMDRFWGINTPAQQVSNVTDAYFAEHALEWELIANVIHNRVYRRIA